jgi:hypothetical protein
MPRTSRLRMAISSLCELCGSALIVVLAVGD